MIKEALGSKVKLIDGDIGMSKWLIDNDGNKKLREGRATKAVMDFIKPSTVTIDVGANIGYYALYCAKKGKFVHAIEPVKANCIRLDENMKLNGYSNYKIYNLAIGSENGLSEFHMSAHSNCGRINAEFHEVKNFTSSFQVETMTLDDFCKKEGIKKIDFVKMDVEGYETEIIKGAKKTLENMPKGSMLFVEIHPKYIKDKTQLDSMLKTIEDSGFKVKTMQNLSKRVDSFSQLKANFDDIHCPRVIFGKY